MMSDSPIQSDLTPPEAQYTTASMGAERVRSFPDELLELAARNAGRWVYEIDPALDREKPVPRDRIVGAWRIDERGSPTGEFVANPGYRPSAPKTRRLPRRAALVALALVVVGLIVAGVVLLLVLPDSTGDRSVHAKPGPRSPVGAINPAPGDPSLPTASSRPAGTHAPVGTTTSPLRNARLEVVATQRVWVCLQDARGRVLINGQIFQPGEISERFTSTAFRIYLGNGAVSFRINGRVHPVTPAPSPVAYRITLGKVVALAAGAQPGCA